MQFYILQELYKLYPNHDILKQAGQRAGMFDKVCGSKKIRELFLRRHRWKDAKAYWDKDADKFKKLSRQYYLYK